eukprot:CAMPEP_0115741632 /NCGR_PEP_ID=MMETSP0272-20121206/90106_1 /TAXON_ID=71861 /ORGANISM="Scrippsiella trochoidea, Strain CCMP3099" /LENGTH=202 /DNA_ID=CAMNT_0003186317 /DNA_START=228 /DNA_END=833 /DNA_ORIENTATION=-
MFRGHTGNVSKGHIVGAPAATMPYFAILQNIRTLGAVFVITWPRRRGASFGESEVNLRDFAPIRKVKQLCPPIPRCCNYDILITHSNAGHWSLALKLREKDEVLHIAGTPVPKNGVAEACSHSRSWSLPFQVASQPPVLRQELLLLRLFCSNARTEQCGVVLVAASWATLEPTWGGRCHFSAHPNGAITSLQRAPLWHGQVL